MSKTKPDNKGAETYSFETNSDIYDALAAEEKAGYRLSFKGRMYAISTIAIFLIFIVPFPDVLYYHLLISLFAITGLAANTCQNQAWFKPWHNYLFVLLDFALLTFTVVYPNPVSEITYPPHVAYRNGNAVYLFILLVGLAFSYRPKLVLWGGFAGAICWGLALAWILSLPETSSSFSVDTAEIAANPIKFLQNPTYIDMGARLQEIVVFMIIAGLIATIVLRARRLVVRQIMSERERHFVRESLGKYVPVAVANAIVADRGFLKPQRQTATMLFADIENFTGLVERTDPADVFAILNDYFSAIGAAIVAEGGVINQFQGDGVLATFNLPVEDLDHAGAAVRAAKAICHICQTRTFVGHRINVRIGIATGEVIAGSVGSDNQLAYTVHGDAVNLAARLEHMNKNTGTNILIAEETVNACLIALEVEHMGEIPIRGRAAASAYSLS